jgi:molecular chaperone GrpE (heat shock protein)
MREPCDASVPKWPFWCGDLLLLGAVYFVYAQGKLPLSLGELVVGASCIAAGAVLGVMPFILQHRAELKLAESGRLADAVAQIKNIEQLAAQISGATAQWQDVQAEAGKTLQAAKGVTEKMTTEMQAFAEFFQRINENEKATLRVEVDKLRRAEAEWLQSLVHMLDHVYALYQGAIRSGQPKVIEQLTSFQSACRDGARRVGLTPFAPNREDPFDPQKHKTAESEPKPGPGATVAEILATGYTFQGRILRPALVRLNGNGGGAPDGSISIPEGQADSA